MGRKSLARVVETNLPKPLLEFSPAQVQKLKDLSSVVLGVVAALGVAAVSVAAPSALKLIKYLPNEKYSQSYYYEKNRGKRKITRTIYYLRDQGYIELIPQGEDFLMKLTQKGRKKTQLINFQSMRFPHSKRWDKIWWFILADVPVECKSQIDAFRNKLKDLGVFTFQKSVWVYPFDPRDELAFLSKYYGLERYITCIAATNLDSEDEQNLRRYFQALV